MTLEFLVLFVVGALAAVITFILHTTFKQNTVRASALVGLFSSLVVFAFPEYLSDYLITHIPLIAFGASFIGMVSSTVISNVFLLGFSGGVFTFIFLNANSIFNGFGGGLGVSACISLLIVLALPIIFKKRTRRIGWLKIKKTLQNL